MIHMDRYAFNQAIGVAIRHVLQSALREESARQHAAAVREEQAGRLGAVRDHNAADRAVEAAGAKTDGVIMNFTDHLYDAIYGDRAESTMEAQRLGATG